MARSVMLVKRDGTPMGEIVFDDPGAAKDLRDTLVEGDKFHLIPELSPNCEHIMQFRLIPT